MGRRREILCSFGAVLVLMSGALLAQSTAEEASNGAWGVARRGVSTPAPQAVPEAAGIIQYDDGEVDDGYPCSTAVCEFNMLFEGVGGTDVTLGSVELCFTKLSGSGTVDYEVVLWDDDGPGGTPGTQIAAYPGTATGVATFPDSSLFLQPVGLETTDSNFYIGVRWSHTAAPGMYTCVDEDGATVQPGFLRHDLAGSWQAIGSVWSDYNALVLRAYVYTPGVVLESQFVPFYFVDTLDPSGTTTLFAVRNKETSDASVHIEFLDVGGSVQYSEDIVLGYREVHTENIRFVPGLATDGDGVKRGLVRITTPGNTDGTHVLAGDFFQVDNAENFATGDRLVRDADFCTLSSIRFMKFGIDDPSRLRVLVNNPRGDNPATDPPSFTVRAYDETSTAFEVTNIYTANNVVLLDQDDLTALGFGSFHFDFTNGGGGVVYAEYSAFGKFSIGLADDCSTE